MTAAPPTATVLAVGSKGLDYLRDTQGVIRTMRVVTYGESEPDIAAEARTLGAEVVVRTRPEPEDLDGTDLVICVGWQYLLADPPPHTVILHDSLLPRYRGFAPTVTALIAGEPRIGVTALLPGTDVDDGPVLAQSSTAVDHPCRIAQAFQLLRPCYVEVTRAVVAALAADGQLSGTVQDHGAATWSQWRDGDDYLIDWSRSAEELARFVLAVGAPYDGARTVTSGGELVVVDDIAVEDRAIEQRTAGKVWSRHGETFDVVCGTGILRVLAARTEDGSRYHPRSLRTRFRIGV